MSLAILASYFMLFEVVPSDRSVEGSPVYKHLSAGCGQTSGKGRTPSPPISTRIRHMRRYHDGDARADRLSNNGAAADPIFQWPLRPVRNRIALADSSLSAALDVYCVVT